MASTKYIKLACLGAFTLLFSLWIAYGTLSTVSGTDGSTETASASSEAMPNVNPDDLVGSETCKACHEDQFKGFDATKHAKLGSIKEYKNKAVGCESCHGPGKAHVEAGGDKASIVSFKNKNSKAISETCMACHDGRDTHNNFRRSEHWRNNVGCTDCHYSHGAPFEHGAVGSQTLVNNATSQNIVRAENAMLKAPEQQLCIGCHTETRAQFSRPFRHKVLEGAMNCSDCHNAHGGFEMKQTKLAVGADASCLKCHSDKQGPFVFEHAPLKTEGCASCHVAHGSNNPKMLTRSNQRQLCMECHSSITNVEEGAPQAPHNQSTTRYQNCTVCHLKVHGSNASTFFFR